MARYRKKPVVIDAWKIGNLMFLAQTDSRRLPEEVLAAHVEKKLSFVSRGVIIRTLEGEMLGGPDDWLIRGVRGELYPCKREIFDATYEAVSEE